MLKQNCGSAGARENNFADISDESGKIQALLRLDDLGDGFSLVEFLDLGDFVGVTGEIVTTRTGEITVQAKEIKLLSKALQAVAFNVAWGKKTLTKDSAKDIWTRF